MTEQRSATGQVDGVPSTAAIGGHPIHPMFIPFPIAFLVGALATDLAFAFTDDTFWARASLWLVGAGLVTGIFAAIFGAIEFLTIERARAHSAGWIPLVGNGIALLLALISLWMRRGAPAAAVMPWGMVLSVVIAILLTVTGWYGGELSYRHKIGVVGARLLGFNVQAVRHLWEAQRWGLGETDTGAMNFPEMSLDQASEAFTERVYGEKFTI